MKCKHAGQCLTESLALTGKVPVFLCFMLEGWRMCDAGYDVLRGVKCAAGAPGTMQVK